MTPPTVSEIVKDVPRINALVAEKVMGIVWDEKRCRVCGWPLVPEGGAGCWASNCSERPMRTEIGAKRADAPAPYASDIAAAWGVVERMRENGHHFDCGTPHSRGKPVSEWYARFGGNMAQPVASTSAPLAICLAALLAVGAVGA